MGKLARGNKAVSLGGVAAVFALALGGGALAVGKLAPNRANVAPPHADALSTPSDFKAFLVGADDYANVPDLDFVRNDVEALASRLVKIGFKKENVVVLKSGGDFSYFPTKKNTSKLYKKFLNGLQKGDFVIVYLSGHGIQATDSEEAFFAPSDVEPKDWFGSSISIDKMLTELDESGAKFRLMIVDACRNDPQKGITKAISVKGLTNIVNAPETTALLQSCQSGEFSYGGDGVSVFTSSLLEALDEKKKPADADADGLVTFSEMLEYVKHRTNELAEEYGDNSQNPNLSGQIPDFVVLNGDSKARLSQVLALIGVALIGVALVGGTVVLIVKGIKAKISKDKEIRGTKKSRRKDNKSEETLSKRQEALRQELKKSFIEGWDVQTAGEQRWFDVREVRYYFRYCPPGEFWMGSPDAEIGRERDETSRCVAIKRGFWMLETPVTQRMWESIMDADASWYFINSKPPSYFSATGDGKDKIQGITDALNLPADNVNWFDCQNFIEKLNTAAIIPKEWKIRLPKETEWEYACRAGTTTPFSWGTSLNGDKANCNGTYPYNSAKPGAFLERTSEPRFYKPNPWGLYDMHGNVCEWCEDSRWDYELDKAINSKEKTRRNVFDAIIALGAEEAKGAKRVLRGGGWDDAACNCRAAFRRYCDPTVRRFSFGFRLVLDCGEEARG